MNNEQLQKCSQKIKLENIKSFKRKQKTIQSQINSGYRSGNWYLDEERRFVAYMKKNENAFKEKSKRRSNRIFKKMAGHVKTRSAQQCRSHHQRYQFNYKTFEGIIQIIQSKLSKFSKEGDSPDHIHYSPIQMKNFLPFENEPLCQYPAQSVRNDNNRVIKQQNYERVKIQAPRPKTGFIQGKIQDQIGYNLIKKGNEKSGWHWQIFKVAQSNKFLLKMDAFI